MHQLLIKNKTIADLYKKYVIHQTTNHPNAPLSTFPEIYNNVKFGLEKKDAENEEILESHVKSVLEAMVYTSKNSIPDMIKRTEENTPEEYKGFFHGI